jgi:dephospho-CoA kinase
MLKLAFYGESGCGKSTVTKICEDYFDRAKKKTAIVKLAEPLYDIQEYIYEKCGISIEHYQQNQVLLEDAAKWMRMVRADSLVNSFAYRLSMEKADIIINDDIRNYDIDYKYLKLIGFFFIRLVCDDSVRIKRLDNRSDLKSIFHSQTTKDYGRFENDYEIKTDVDLRILNKSVYSVLDDIVLRLP